LRQRPKLRQADAKCKVGEKERAVNGAITQDGFKAFVWSSVISYNLVRLARLQAG